ncbi:Nuclear transport factor 2Eukaryote [Penicillium daleae]|uniref:Nuclear transport factor 2Eukaryote n=1 Tax=Penicillium daleae TaxID=63821 RepID=A0AAD6CD50_9EURO|nr:Nuclear transport factor 2Eukaryote [Penicillium daleae]KAJ5461101.1 Nuclear transport factor 2Eukaryote [Penicillium daleae]
MADMTQVPINGNYAAQHGFPDSFNPAHAAMNTAANFQPAQSSTPTSATPSAEQQKNEITKDEVGWFFVEQYYTTMSRNPDKLHLFYSKRSQLVFGTEAASVPVAIGTKAINDKIKALDFQDCKVRVLNVDSQASFDNILVSVIGEISNKSEPSRKFVQTFVLAEQPNGYYVLNDIFRYLVEEVEEDEAVTEEITPAVSEAPQTTETAATSEEAQVTDEAAASKADEKLEEVSGEGEQPEKVAPKTNGTPAEEPEEAPVPVVEPEALKEEKPQTAEPSPAPEQKEVPAKETAAPAAPAAAPAAPVPAVPKTWASIASKVGAAKAAAAAAAAAAPAVPAATAAAPAPTPAAAAAAPKAAPAPATDSAATTPRAAVTPTPAAEKDAASADSAGWQTAGADHKKTQSRAGEDQVVLGYMKNINEKVDAGLLKQTLTRFGKLKYFDVNRPKNSAFVEFAEPSAYAAAVAANPHQIGTEQIILEERRPRPNNFGNGYPAGRGRGGRGGFQRDGRGGFARGRGGNAPAKGRTGAPAA